MSRIDEQIKILQIKKKKIEFLDHILNSTLSYNNSEFKDVKDDVVKLITEFVKTTTSQIESDGVIAHNVPKESPTSTQKVESQSQQNQSKPAELSVHEKSSFALNHRHLAGKLVSVANKENLTVKGTVVGLDAPLVLVQTETGPIIKVPVNQVSLV